MPRLRVVTGTTTSRGNGAAGRVIELIGRPESNGPLASAVALPCANVWRTFGERNPLMRIDTTTSYHRTSSYEYGEPSTARL